MSSFLSMGGYARWVWSAFGLTAAVLLVNVVVARQAYRRCVREVRAWVEDQPARERA
jgi:heme exporter protein D